MASFLGGYGRHVAPTKARVIRNKYAYKGRHKASPGRASFFASRPVFNPAPMRAVPILWGW